MNDAGSHHSKAVGATEILDFTSSQRDKVSLCGNLINKVISDRGIEDVEMQDAAAVVLPF